MRLVAPAPSCEEFVQRSGFTRLCPHATWLSQAPPLAHADAVTGPSGVPGTRRRSHGMARLSLRCPQGSSSQADGCERRPSPFSDRGSLACGPSLDHYQRFAAKSGAARRNGPGLRSLRGGLHVRLQRRTPSPLALTLRMAGIREREQTIVDTATIWTVSIQSTNMAVT